MYHLLLSRHAHCRQLHSHTLRDHEWQLCHDIGMYFMEEKNHWYLGHVLQGNSNGVRKKGHLDVYLSFVVWKLAWEYMCDNERIPYTGLVSQEPPHPLRQVSIIVAGCLSL